MLKSGRAVKKSGLLFRLDPVILDNLLRVGGRLRLAQDDYNCTKTPTNSS